MTKKIKYPFVLNVSGWKDKISWKDVHPRPNLVICQASNGVQERDDLLPVHWKSLKRMQIKRGAYHVFDPTIDSQLQINNYLEAVEHAGGFDEDCIPSILDVSNFAGNYKKYSLGEKIRLCLEEMQIHTGQTPIIHISRRCWQFLKSRRRAYPDWANEYSLWVPWYPSDPDLYKRPPKNTYPNGWEDWAIWKYAESATISGIKGYVSLSTLSEAFATKIGLDFENSTFGNPQQSRLKFKAVIVATEGVIIRRQARNKSKMLAFLAQGSELVGESVEFKNKHEAWLQVTKPIIGWCPIVDTGRTYLSINNRG